MENGSFIHLNCYIQKILIQKKKIVSVPCYGKEFLTSSIESANYGYATFRLKVKSNHKLKNYALKSNIIISAYKIWIDDELIIRCGKVDENPCKTVAKILPQIKPINPTNSNFDIIVQISNFEYANGGFSSSLVIGEYENIISEHEKKICVDMILFGSTIIMALYHFSLYLKRKTEYSYLYFSIICFLQSMRVLFMGEMLIYKFTYSIFPEIPLWIFLKTSMLTLTLSEIFLVLFINSIFSEETSHSFFKISIISGIIYSLIIIFSSDTLMNSSLCFFEVASILILIFLIIVSIKAFNSRKNGSLIIMVSLIMELYFIINDILNYLGVIHTEYVIHLGVFLLTIAQSFMLITHQENLLVESEMRFLRSQIVPHFLFNILNATISTIRYYPEKAIKLIRDLCRYLRYNFDFDYDKDFIHISEEILHAKLYLTLEQVRLGNRLSVYFDIEKNVDFFITPFILQPIVENSIKHGISKRLNGGTIKISLKKDAMYFKLIVEDDGIGMDISTINHILNCGRKKKSTGVGITNVQKRLLKKYKKGLSILSEINIGTQVIIQIPLKKG